MIFTYICVFVVFFCCIATVFSTFFSASMHDSPSGWFFFLVLFVLLFKKYFWFVTYFFIKFYFFYFNFCIFVLYLQVQCWWYTYHVHNVSHIHTVFVALIIGNLDFMFLAHVWTSVFLSCSRFDLFPHIVHRFLLNASFCKCTV